MIDIQTYRVRIAKGPDIVSKILHRKALRYKLRAHEAQRHEDEDLLRKFLKTLSPSHTSYLVLIVLLFTIHVCKYLTIPTALFTKCNDIQQIFGRQHKTLLDYKFTEEVSLGYAIESALSIVCFGACLSSVGAVHFIAILLLIAGIEPNPGPKGEPQSFLSIGNIQDIRTLNLENCNLTELPHVESLPSLLTLNVDNNQITDISSLMNSKLQSISVEGNPITEITFSRTNCPSLRHIRCGSISTKFIHIDILKLIAEKELTLEITAEHLMNVLIPPYSILSTADDVMKYVNSTDFQIDHYKHTVPESDHNLIDTIELVLENERRNIKSFVLSNESALYSEIRSLGMERILKHRMLQNITKLVLNNCDLNEVPNMVSLSQLTDLDLSGNLRLGAQIENKPIQVRKSLKRLIVRNCGLEILPLYCIGYVEYLDVSDNGIKSIEGAFIAKRLKQLCLGGNLVKFLEVRPYSFPALERLEFGSKHIEYIGFQLLQLTLDSLLRVYIVCDGIPNLVFPPERIIRDGPVADFIKRPYSYIREVGEERRAMVLRWMLEKYHDSLEEFSCRGFENVIQIFNPCQLQDLIDHYACLHSVKKLELSNCELKQCPNFKVLHNLEDLNLDDNSIKELAGFEENNNLKTVSVRNNLLTAVNVHPRSMTRIILGSDRLKYIGIDLLRAKLDGCMKIYITDYHAERLLFPQNSVLQDNSKLENFVKNPLQKVLGIKDISQRRETLVWMFTTNQYGYTDLDLSYQYEIFGDMAEKDMTAVLESDCLQHLRHLTLKNCDLKKVPKLKIFNMLHSLDLSDNYLTTFELNSESKSQLRHLNVIGNPLERIEIDVGNLPHLEVLKCGSPATKYISIPVLERCMRNMSLEIPPQYRGSLLLPSYDIIKNDLVHEFIGNSVKYSTQISDLEERKNILMWLLSNRKDQESFRLTGQKDLCMEPSLLKKLLQEPYLMKIKRLSLDKCGLTSLPNIRHLANLEVLDIGRNAICDASMNYKNLPKSLSELNIAGNPIETLWTDADTLASWKVCDKRSTPLTIRCGSKHTRFISFTLLDAFQNDQLEIKVESEFREILLMPTYAILSSTSLGEYIVQPEQSLNNVENVKDMEDILHWLFKVEQKEFHTVFALRNPLCSDLNISNYFSDNAFKMVRTMSLKCQLFNPPNLSHLPKLTSHLVTLDISDNNIEDLSSGLCKLRLLNTLQINNNPIEIIDFDLSLFPQLTRLICGSREMKYIRPDFS